MLNKLFIQNIKEDLFEKKMIDVNILRLDMLHPVISGNKIFKLKYYLEEAKKNNTKGILTLGGSYSNHLVASSFAAKETGLRSIGLVRGEKPSTLSSSLEDCLKYGMELKFLSRIQFDSINFITIKQEYPDFTIIPQGGYGPNGARGAAEIMSFEESSSFDFIMAACGTGTMGAGLINASKPNQKVVLVSVLKNNFSVLNEIEDLLNPNLSSQKKYDLFFDFHLGGYAKKNKYLYGIMNEFYSKHQIKTDFVYTGKVINAFYALIERDYFPMKSRILLIHSGGLQGNRSLIGNELQF